MDEKRLDSQSFDNVHARIEELKRMFPEAVSKGRLEYPTRVFVNFKRGDIHKYGN